MKHSDWLDQTTDSESVRAIARRIDIPQRTLANQVDRDHISPENVIAIGIEYTGHPVRALVDTDYLPEQYAADVDPVTALRTVTEEELADEVLRRMKLPGAHDTFTTPVDELAARRHVSTDAYAADSSPDEPEPGDDDYHDGP